MLKSLKDSAFLSSIFFVILMFFAPLCVEGGFAYKESMRNFISFSPENPYFFVLLFFGTILAVASFYFPRFGLIVMLFFIMISTDMPVGGEHVKAERSVSIRIEDIVLVLVSAGWLLNKARTRTLSLFKNVPVNKVIIIMSFVMLVATSLGIFQGTVSFHRAFFFIMKRLQYFWIFFMALNVMETDKEAERSIKLMLIVSTIVACIGIVQFFLFPASELVQGGATATVGFGRANTLADFYLIIIGLILGLIIYTKTHRWLLFYNTIFFLLMFALLMTKSRGAYVSIVPLFFTIFIVSRSKKILNFFLMLLLLGGLYYAFTHISMGEGGQLIKKHDSDIAEQFSSIKAVSEGGVEADSSLYARYTSCRDIWPEIKSHLLLGHGVGAMQLGFIDVQYFHELYDTGFIGLIAFLYMNIIIFLSVLLYFMHTGNSFSKGIALGFLGAQAAVLAHGLTITSFYTILNMEAFWFILAMVMLMYYNEEFKRKSESAPVRTVNYISLQARQKL